MPTIKILAVDFASRQNLESYISAEYGQDIDANRLKDVIIEGKREELKKLQLDDQNIIYGIKVRIVDSPTKNLVKK